MERHTQPAPDERHTRDEDGILYTTDAAPVTRADDPGEGWQNDPQPAADPEPRETRAAQNAEIRQIAQTAGLPQSWIDAQIDAAATPDEARSAAFAEMQRRSREAPTRTTRARIIHDHNDPAEIIQRAGEAIYARTDPSHELSPAARPFAHMRLADIARETMRLRGEHVTGLSDAQVITRATGGQHTTSDFPNILGDAVGRRLRREYEAAPSGIQQIARQTTARDFRTIRPVQLSEAPLPTIVPEGGEIQHGSMGDAGESYALATYARIISVSRHALVNDDLGAFERVPAALAQACRDLEAQTLTALVEANPQMADGIAVFDANHLNVASAAYPSLSALTEMRLLLRKQLGQAGRFINVTPRYLLVPPELETVAEQLVADVQARTTADVNPFNPLEVAVEPRLTDDEAYYLMADPATVDGLEYAYLEGAPGPQVESRIGFEVEGVEIKCRLDFGAGWVDWRGAVKNAGGTP